jgi:hypothetical protein
VLSGQPGRSTSLSSWPTSALTRPAVQETGWLMPGFCADATRPPVAHGQEQALKSGRERRGGRTKRVAVFGNAGRGKSTLARELAQITSLPLHSLDRIKYKPGGGEVVPPCSQAGVFGQLKERRPPTGCEDATELSCRSKGHGAGGSAWEPSRARFGPYVAKTVMWRRSDRSPVSSNRAQIEGHITDRVPAPEGSP